MAIFKTKRIKCIESILRDDKVTDYIYVIHCELHFVNIKMTSKIEPARFSNEN